VARSNGGPIVFLGWKRTDGERFPVVVKQADGVRLIFKAFDREKNKEGDLRPPPLPSSFLP